MDQQMIDLYQQALRAIKTTFAKNKSPLRTALTCSNADIKKGAVLVSLELYLKTKKERPDAIREIQAELLGMLNFAIKIETNPRQKVLLTYVIKEIGQ